MSKRNLGSKTSITETSQNNNNLQEYLTQYLLTDVPNPSDDSDFQDTSYKTDIEYEHERKRRKRQEQTAEIQENFKKQQQAETYWNQHKNDPFSIFNYRGMKFEHYSHKFISFVFMPSDFSKKYKYVNNEYIELNSDDEKLFLSREERKLRKRKIRDIWKRMLPPQSSEEVNSSICKS